MIGIKRNRNRETSYVPNRPLTRVELHVHLDGSIRPETIWELAKEKKVKLPGRGTFEDLQNYLVVKEPKDLQDFLSRFDVIINTVAGDLKAIERVAYEFVEDSALSGIAYFEARFCPHLLLPKDKELSQAEQKKWVWDITGALVKGLNKGHAEFGTNGNLIATCIRGYPTSWYTDTIELSMDKSFHGGRLIGIDVAAVPSTTDESLMFEADSVKLFNDAAKLGIRRTVHAGESGSPGEVTGALDTLHAERIGHGYRIATDPGVYKRVLKEQVHLECCPWSSLLTGSISMAQHPHPIVKFFQDGFNVSVNTDDPTITGTKIDDEYRLLTHWGLSEAHFVKGNFDAARSCFLPENEKKDLIQKIAMNIGYIC